MERLQQIYKDSGRPNAAEFKAAALLEGVNISKRDGKDFVKNQNL